MIGNVSVIQVNPNEFVPRNITLGFIVFLFIVYLAIFLFTYVQLWMVYCNGHRRWSFQSMFLYICLFWSGLRATLFSFYLTSPNANTTTSWESITLKNPSFLPFWTLFSLPVCLQFFILCLLNLFFLQVALKMRPRYAANPQMYKFPIRLALAVIVLLFLAVNISTAFVILKQGSTSHCFFQQIRIPIIIRVCVNNLLFVSCALSLTVCLIKLARSSSANILLPFRDTTVCRSVSVGITIVLLYLTRCVFNIMAVVKMPCKGRPARHMDWYVILDQTELLAFTDPSISLIAYVIIIFIWEILPTSVTLLIFKVRRGNCMFCLRNQEDLTRSGHFYDHLDSSEVHSSESGGLLR